MTVSSKLKSLREVCERINELAPKVEDMRDTKWALVRELKDAGYDFRATPELDTRELYWN